MLLRHAFHAVRHDGFYSVRIAVFLPIVGLNIILHACVKPERTN